MVIFVSPINELMLVLSCMSFNYITSTRTLVIHVWLLLIKSTCSNIRCNWSATNSIDIGLISSRMRQLTDLWNRICRQSINFSSNGVQSFVVFQHTLNTLTWHATIQEAVDVFLNKFMPHSQMISNRYLISL